MAFFDYDGIGLCDGQVLGGHYNASEHPGSSDAHFVLGDDDIKIVGAKQWATLYQDGNEVDLRIYAIQNDMFGDGFITAYRGIISTYAFTIVEFEDGVAVHLKDIFAGTLWEGYAAYGDDPYKYCGRI